MSKTTAYPTIPLADVAAHNTAESCYVTVGANVYDVTDFIADHPGGGELVLKYAGKDVAKVMQDEISHQHSDAAYEILNERLVGFMASTDILESATQHGQADDILPLLPNEAGKAALRPQARQDLGGEDIFQTTGLSGPEDLTRETDETADYKQHQFLDLRRPLLMQVWNGGFSKKFYLEQVHRPRYIKGGASAPLFGNFLEPLSKTVWWVVPAIWWPAVSYGTMLANQGMTSPMSTAAFFVFGVAFWTLVEYLMHRGLFHIDGCLPDNRVAITAHFLLHGIHHYLPMDKLRLVMPPTLFVALAAPFWKLAHTVFFWDWYIATAVFCGGVFGYTLYDMTHYFLHHRTLPAYYRQLKKYHLQHHYADYENGFGVTSRFWDRVFGTELNDLPSAPKLVKLR